MLPSTFRDLRKAHVSDGKRASDKEPVPICCIFIRRFKGSAWPGHPGPQSQDAITGTETSRSTPKPKGGGLLPPCTPLSPAPWVNGAQVRSVARLRYLFQQHPSQPPVRAGLLPEEAPNDQTHEGQA